ncbi:hypothetical protein KSP39_PZI006266 [Platanthera zijinensis]|uniref:Pre-rRNA-processing protein TSR2 homolog n=1 Tax=Platanthera zijinensis TaxID=2320716 RepID=A0AAP0BS38_9ASPA
MAMDSSSWRSTQNNSQVLSPEAVPFLEEGISLVLSRWTALQLAVQEGWGGQNSPQKLKELASGISLWFTHAKEESPETATVGLPQTAGADNLQTAAADNLQTAAADNLQTTAADNLLTAAVGRT